jgi:ACS family hexuronate transporter-like MFS transporter
MAGAVGGALLMVYAGNIVQLTGSYASLFILAASVYLFSLLILVLLAPGLKKVDSLA